MSEIEERGYVHPEVLVSTEWVARQMNDPGIRLVESNEDPLLYPSGHIPGAVEVDWTRDLNHPVRRDYLNGEGFQNLMRRMGADEDTTIVLYGDQNNWWATYAFWIFRLFGLEKLKIMDGGRLKWQKEGRELTKEKPAYEPSNYTAPARDDSQIRAFRQHVLEHVEARRPLVDVRSPQEYSGERLHMEAYPNEGALRGGHIPGASNIPWGRAVDSEDGTFKPADELQKIYQEEHGLKEDQDIITYCRIGERSSHSWFVLTYLLGYEQVRNYDGSWTEWGNLVDVPIER